MSEPVLRAGATGAVPTSVDAVRASWQDAPAAEAAPTTGDDAVDEALRTLGDIGQRDVRTQVALFEDVHGALRDRLADAEG